MKNSSQWKNILYEEKGELAIITINRPHAYNILTQETREELFRLFGSLRENDKIRVVILTGAGKHFGYGVDIREIHQLNAVTGKEFAERGHHLFFRIEYLGKPVIAAIRGYCVGGSMEIALACSLRYAATDAKLGLPEVKIGIFPGFGGSQRMPRLIGKSRALELILTGAIIDAQEAYRLGLVDKIFPPEKLMEETEKLAQNILSNAPLAIKLALDTVNKGYEIPADKGLAIEADAFGLVCATEDMKEGTSAFLEKRKPHFKGR